MKRTTAYIFIISAIFMMTGCSLTQNNTETIYTETDKIQSLLPKIYESGNVSDVYFTSETLGSNKFSLIPGPSDYKYTGVITIDQDFAQRIYDNYELEDKTITIDDSIKEYISNEEDSWMTSPSFTADFKPQYYGGNIYILDNQIYFELSTT
ncbi:MAG: hypothetical protein MJ172_04985 [Clostridia bacterium]|nr:hypothetical protein [Clostridia bacterium]